ncbi:imm11 family protein [Acinetobacter sp. WU_MDCI_Abxc222]|uniref:imm11 family protein n=1 Tax=Acinetobacter sp. WU_MDCI_Abxc222 TaxID=2850076 RepID=UPI0021CDA31D|nr:DUF1629 domain-containing protein [Acinetobacter sp. WU_MDCI_Abxc222]MCU4562722.1 hypothetical protein [Acinetobacter sp. WU_MDCI_Abxc222]
MTYYEMKADFYEFPHQYFITEIVGFDNPRAQIDWDEFLLENSVNKGKKYIAIIDSGDQEVDFTTTFYGFCVISHRFKLLLEEYRLTDCMVVPLEFNKQLSQQFYLLIDPLRYDCVDETNSDFQKFIENDPVRPDLAGHYRAFFKLIIDAEKTENADFFRIDKENATIIVSQNIKDIYETNHLTGACFTKVTVGQ